MDKKLQTFLDQTFAPYGSFPSRTEVIKELLVNLQEKYADLKRQGLSDDEAYQATVESFGDASEIMEQLPHAEQSQDHILDEPEEKRGIGRILKDTFKQARQSNSKFAMSDLQGTNLSDTDLIGADFSMSALKDTSFERSNLTKAKFRAADLNAVNFGSANLTGAVFTASNTKDTNFNNANLTGTKFKASAVQGATFAGATLHGTVFADSDLGGISFDGQMLEGVNFTRSSLRKTGFKNATLHDVTFHHCDPKPAVFAGATMDKITYALLQNTKADLTDVKLV